MQATSIDPVLLKQTLKEALAETLQEQRGLFHELFVEVLEDFALAEGIREGSGSELVDRDEVMSLLEGED